ncbi:MAG: DUF5615 family PIN-like protein [Bryobacterales bacterium]|nr:DUF5615 family PIN-like protein [Bryobacterales bacterium]
MRILVDENIPRMTVDGLREVGHDVKDIRGTEDEGLADTGFWDVALRERRLLITTIPEGYVLTPYRKRDDEAEMRKRVDPEWKRILPRW